MTVTNRNWVLRITAVLSALVISFFSVLPVFAVDSQIETNYYDYTSPSAFSDAIIATRDQFPDYFHDDYIIFNVHGYCGCDYVVLSGEITCDFSNPVWFYYRGHFSVFHVTYSNGSYSVRLFANTDKLYTRRDEFDPSFGIIFNEDLVSYRILDYTASNRIYDTNGNVIFDADFFQAARLTRRNLKMTAEELLPIGILVLCSMVSVLLLARWAKQLQTH